MGLFSKRVIPESQLHHLKDYSFNPGNFTYIDNLMLNVLWKPSLKFIPLWINANWLTLIGGLCVFIMNFLVFYYVPNFKASNVPLWTSLLSSILVFLYTTLDGIDGMQARRLKLASPLGQLLDHGTDALVSSFFCYFTFLVSPTGFGLLNATITVSALLNTAAVNWQEETFGTFSYTNSFFIFGVSEPLLSVVALLFVNYFFPKFWLSSLPKFLSKYRFLKFLVKYLPKNLDWFSAFLYLALALSLYTFVGFPYEMYKKHKSVSRLMKLFLFLTFNCLLPPLLTVALPRKLHTLYSLFVSSFGGFSVVFIIISNISNSGRHVLYPEFFFHYLLVFFGYGVVLSRKLFGWRYDRLVFNSTCFRNVVVFLTVLGTFLGFLKSFRTLYEIKTFLQLPFFTTRRPNKKQSETRLTN